LGTAYNLVVAPQEADTAFKLAEVTVSAAADLTAYSGGSDFHLASRASTGVGFTLTTTIRPVMSLILSDITNAAGSGSVGIIGG
jgi:hypothetical protein